MAKRFFSILIKNIDNTTAFVLLYLCEVIKMLNSIVDRIIKKRKELKISQAKLAEWCGLKQSVIARMKQERRYRRFLR